MARMLGRLMKHGTLYYPRKTYKGGAKCTNDRCLLGCVENRGTRAHKTMERRQWRKERL